MAEVGRHLWRLSVHPAVHREVTFTTLPRITPSFVLNISVNEIETTWFLWAVSSSVWLPSEDKVSYYLIVAIDSFPSVGLHREESVSFSITPHNQTFIHIDKALWAAFSSWGWTVPSLSASPLRLTLQSFSHLHCPPLDLFQYVPLPLVLGVSELDSELQMCFTQAE